MSTNRGAQITGAMSWRLNFVPWYLMLIGTQYRPCFMSTLWRLECGCGSYSFGKSVHRSLPLNDRLTLHLFYNQHLATFEHTHTHVCVYIYIYMCVYVCVCVCVCGPGSSVGIATDYRLDGPG